MEWYALRSCANSGLHRARSLRVSAVMAIDSILMSISGMAGAGVVPKSDSKEGTVTVEPEPLSTERAVEIEKVSFAPDVAVRAETPLAPFTTSCR